MNGGMHYRLVTSHYIDDYGSLEITITLQASVTGEYGAYYNLASDTVNIDGHEWLRKLAASRLTGD